jgi:hypothetical protein
MENWAATPKFDDMRMSGKGIIEEPNAWKFEAVERAQSLADYYESSRSLMSASRPSKRNVFRTCDLSYSVCGVLLTA